jgi:hypothetical protein
MSHEQCRDLAARDIEQMQARLTRRRKEIGNRHGIAVRDPVPMRLQRSACPCQQGWANKIGGGCKCGDGPQRNAGDPERRSTQKSAPVQLCQTIKYS